MRPLPTENLANLLAHPYNHIHYERVRAHEKHDGAGQSMERKEFTDPAWLPVLIEEVGEVAKEVNEHRHRRDTGITVDDVLHYALAVRKELVQVAAMAVAWIAACDEYIRSQDIVLEMREAGEDHLLP